MSETSGEARYQSALRAWAERKVREWWPDAETVVIDSVAAEMDGGYGSSGGDDSYWGSDVDVTIIAEVDGTRRSGEALSSTQALNDLLAELLGPPPVGA